VSYELVYTAADHTADTASFSGLREADALTNATYDDQRSDLDAERSGVGRPSVGGRAVGGRTAPKTRIVRADSELPTTGSVAADRTRQDTHQPQRRTVVAAVS
jgi:hypothetical protein